MEIIIMALFIQLCKLSNATAIPPMSLTHLGHVSHIICIQRLQCALFHAPIVHLYGFMDYHQGDVLSASG